MSYSIKLDKKVEKFLDKQTDKFVEKFFTKALILAEDPYTSLLDIKRLQGVPNAYRLRIGSVRFLYTLDQETILIYFFDA